MKQGILTKGEEGRKSSLFCKKVKNIFNIKMS
jgi:hypothetical protein